MGKHLKSYVHVHDEAGETHVYGPEDDVPEEHAELIGEHAWVDDDEEDLPDNRLGVAVANPGGGPQPRLEPTGSSGRSRRPAAKRPAAKKAAKPAAKPPAAEPPAETGSGDGDGAGGSGSGD